MAIVFRRYFKHPSSLRNLINFHARGQWHLLISFNSVVVVVMEIEADAGYYIVKGGRFFFSLLIIFTQVGLGLGHLHLI